MALANISTNMVLITTRKNVRLILCRLSFIVKQCNCRPLGYDWIDIRLCSPHESGVCVKNAIQAYRSSDSASMCNCPTPCIESTYTTSLSMSVFPGDIVSIEYEDKLRKEEMTANESNTNSTPFKLRKNLVYLDIFYDELSVTQFIQVPSMVDASGWFGRPNGAISWHERHYSGRGDRVFGEEDVSSFERRSIQ